MLWQAAWRATTPDKMSTSGVREVGNGRTVERLDRLGGQEMLPLSQHPHYTFRFTDDRIIPRFHLEGIEPGVRVAVFKFDPTTGGGLGLLATATVGEGGWVELEVPLIVRAGDAFIAVPQPGG
jgi:hypothetical protein